MPTALDKVLYTAKAHTTGGRDGAARSDDGRLDIKLSSPGTSDERRAMTRDLGPLLEDMRTSVRPLGDMPLVVLSARGNEPNPPLFKPDEEAAQRQKVIAGHEMVARLSTNSVHAIADHSGHFMQVDARRLVVASVKQVVEAARTHGRVDAKALEPFLHEGPYPPRD